MFLGCSLLVLGFPFPPLSRHASGARVPIDGLQLPDAERVVKVTVSAFATCTDSETWAGNIHPAQALRQYRDEFVGNATFFAAGSGLTRVNCTRRTPGPGAERDLRLHPGGSGISPIDGLDRRADISPY
jgi:hypothetical protein